MWFAFIRGDRCCWMLVSEMRWNNAAMINAFSSWDGTVRRAKTCTKIVYLTVQPIASECYIHSAIYYHSHGTRIDGLSQSSQNSTNDLVSIKSEPTPMLLAGFEPAIPAINRPENYALDSTASGTGSFHHSLGYFCEMHLSLREFY